MPMPAKAPATRAAWLKNDLRSVLTSLRRPSSSLLAAVFMDDPDADGGMETTEVVTAVFVDTKASAAFAARSKLKTILLVSMVCLCMCTIDGTGLLRHVNILAD